MVDADEPELWCIWSAHEAGHAVTASILGLDLGSVELNRDPRSGSSANGITWAAPPTPGAAAATFPPATLLGAGMVTPEVAWLTFLFAGGIAETRATGALEPIGRYADHMQAQNWLTDLDLAALQRREYRDRAELLAEEIVLACWSRIEEIAATLALSGKLEGNVVVDRCVAYSEGIDWHALIARVDARQKAGDIPRSFSWTALAEAAQFPPDFAKALAAMDDQDSAVGTSGAPDHTR